jgi:RNA polymerase sigma-70 factor (ECF subfamily)
VIASGLLIQPRERRVESDMNAVHVFPTRSYASAVRLPRGKPVTNGSTGDQPLSGEEQKRLVTAIAEEADRAAFQRLFVFFAPRLKTFVMRRGLGSGAAEEVVQETMLSVWRKAAYFNAEKAGVATWIYTIARNLTIDYQRRDRSGAAIEEDPSDEPDAPVTGEAIVLASEREERVRNALTFLSPEQLAVVRLSFFSEKPHVEIAEELGIPLGTVKSRVRLAMQRLRTLLDDLT